MNRTVKSRKVGNNIVSIKRLSNSMYCMQWQRSNGKLEYPLLLGNSVILWPAGCNPPKNKQLVITIIRYLQLESKMNCKA